MTDHQKISQDPPQDSTSESDAPDLAKRKGTTSARHISEQASAALESLNASLEKISETIKEINPADLRLQAMRRRGGSQVMAGSSSAKKILGKKTKATSAIRLRLNMCGSKNCTGCPHAHWGVWRAYKDHTTGATQHMMSEVKTKEQLFAYARNAPDAKTLELVKQALKLIEDKRKLVEAFNMLGRFSRAFEKKTLEKS